MKNILIIVFVLVIIGFVYYFGFYQKDVPSEELFVQENQVEENQAEENQAEEKEEPLGIANLCEEQGGIVESVKFEEGEDRLCFFDDGSMCWQWDFFREDCNKGQLKIEVLQEGEGRLAGNGDTAVVHYVGMLENGTKFDSSIDINMPFSFVLGEGKAIKGWEFGVLGMKAGEKRKLIIAPELAYGKAGAGGVIPPNAILIFEVEMLEIK